MSKKSKRRHKTRSRATYRAESRVVCGETRPWNTKTVRVRDERTCDKCNGRPASGTYRLCPIHYQKRGDLLRTARRLNEQPGNPNALTRAWNELLAFDGLSVHAGQLKKVYRRKRDIAQKKRGAKEEGRNR